MLKYASIILIVLIVGCSGKEATVQPVGFEEPSREKLKKAMHYHGVTFAEQDHDGQWYFYRDGKRCRLFAYLNSAN